MRPLNRNDADNKTTLAEYLMSSSQILLHGEMLTHLLLNIADCVKSIAALAGRGALINAINTPAVIPGVFNVQGEVQMDLDVLSNDLMIEKLRKSNLVHGLVSEELDEAYILDKNPDTNKLIVVFDPLDGSSNIDVNISTGTIFSILPGLKNQSSASAFLQPGRSQVAAGYAIYGPSTMLVLTIGQGVQGFTLDAQTQEFVLTHPNIQIPEVSANFAINASNERYWEPPVQHYIKDCIAGNDGPRKKDFNMRWVASMVADIHRILMRGGVYLYPADNKLPLRAGRLRLLYEANPMSFIMEQAGGKSSTGRQRILDIQPGNIHQRIPVIMGSSAEINLIESYHHEFDLLQSQETL